MEPAHQRRQTSVVLGGLFFLGYLTCQAVFAASCLVAGRGCLMTWSMYSGLEENPKVFVVWKAGGETRLDEDKGIDGVGRILGVKWDWAQYVPPYLCDHLPEVQAVRLEYRRDPARGRTILCRP
jgi:hypothetical protein